MHVHRPNTRPPTSPDLVTFTTTGRNLGSGSYAHVFVAVPRAGGASGTPFEPRQAHVAGDAAPAAPASSATTGKLAAKQTRADVDGLPHASAVRELGALLLLHGVRGVPRVRGVHVSHADCTSTIALPLMRSSLLNARGTRARKLPLPFCRAMTRTLVHALAHAHVNGLTHRDVKPENIMFRARLDECCQSAQEWDAAHREKHRDGGAQVCRDPVDDMSFPLTDDARRASGAGDFSPPAAAATAAATALPRRRQETDAGAADSPPRAPTDGAVALIDWGLARQSPTSKAVRSPYVVTRWYRAPEILLGFTNYGPPSDMWALGATVAEALTGVVLFPGRDQLHQLHLIFSRVGAPTERTWPDALLMLRRRNIVFRQSGGGKGGDGGARGARAPDRARGASLAALRQDQGAMHLAHVPPVAEDFIARCLTLDPLRRLTALQAVQHPFVRGAPGPPPPLPVGSRLEAMARAERAFFHGARGLAPAWAASAQSRAQLFDWLVEVHDHLRLRSLALPVAMHLVHARFRTRPYPCGDETAGVVAMSALLLAAAAYGNAHLTIADAARIAGVPVGALRRGLGAAVQSAARYGGPMQPTWLHFLDAAAEACALLGQPVSVPSHDGMMPARGAYPFARFLAEAAAVLGDATLQYRPSEVAAAALHVSALGCMPSPVSHAIAHAYKRRSRGSASPGSSAVSASGSASSPATAADSGGAGESGARGGQPVARRGPSQLSPRRPSAEPGTPNGGAPVARASLPSATRMFLPSPAAARAATAPVHALLGIPSEACVVTVMKSASAVLSGDLDRTTLKFKSTGTSPEWLRERCERAAVVLDATAAPTQWPLQFSADREQAVPGPAE